LRAEQLTHWLAMPVAAVFALLLAGCGPDTGKIEMDPAKAFTDAKIVLLQAAEDADPLTRCHAMEALAGTLGPEAGTIYVQELGDDAPAVRFAAALAVADSRYTPALPVLVQRAADKKLEPDKRVFCALICALHALGNDKFAGELGVLLFDPESEVRRDAAMAMGRMGDASAVGPLQMVLTNEQDDATKLQITEALAMLGDTGSAEVLEAYTKGYFLDLRLAAIPAISKSGSPRAVAVLRSLLDSRQPVRVRISAAGQLARMGMSDPESYNLCVAALTDADKLLKESGSRSRRAADNNAASLRCLAALSLGCMGNKDAAALLHPLLRSPDGSVRVAAALGVLRLLKAYRPPRAGEAASQPASQPASAPTSKPAPALKLPQLNTAGGKD
jgi:HEAT repeat protein